jgi:hypothetical protein
MKLSSGAIAREVMNRTKDDPQPKVIILQGENYITLSFPELRIETCNMIMEDARRLVERLNELSKRMQDLL